MNDQFRSINRIRKSHFAFISFIALCLTIVALTFLSQASAQKTDTRSELSSLFPGPPQSIAFTSTRAGNNDVFVMDPDGMNQVPKTSTSSSDVRPEISPDGTQIVFASNRVFPGNPGGDHTEIFVMNFDGTGVTPLTSFGHGGMPVDSVNNTWPRWSPDGQWIAFQSGNGATKSQIFRIQHDGSSLTQVTSVTDSVLNLYPAWSPDGTRLAIRRNTDIYLIDSDLGTNPLRLTSQGTVNQMASFSPDGTKIAFLSNRDACNGTAYNSVFIMDSDGNNQFNFTPKPCDYVGTWASRAPAWSPNGQYIYFTATRSASAGSLEQIFVKPASGVDETETQLTSSPGANLEATVRRVHAPTINSVTATPNVLWPPKNQMVAVSLNVDVTDNSDPAPVCQITDVTSNEAISGTDWQIAGPLDLELRAARSGLRTGGRVYVVTVSCTNTSDLTSSATVTVTVPHDQRK